MADETPPPTQVAGFRIQDLIAKGGMGAVYRAYQVSMDRTVAVKVLATQYTADPVFAERFLKEARAAARLSHPNIVQAIDVGQAEGRYYFVMEYVEGPTLATLVRERKKLPPAEACGVITQIARALLHANRVGMLHLDIKPGNIMLTPTGLAKLADFGLARHVEDEDTIYAQKKIIFGTPHYMSPEQIRGGPDLDTRSDIYSLGVTFYELATGKNPFSAPTTRDILRNVKTGNCPPAQVADADVPTEYSRVIAKMMAVDRDQRYANPDELLVDLEALARQETPPVAFGLPRPGAEPAPVPEPPLPEHPRRHRLAVAVVVVALVVLAAVVALVIHTGNSRLLFPTTTSTLRPSVVVNRDPVRDQFKRIVRQAEVELKDGHFAAAVKLYEDFGADPASASFSAEIDGAIAAVRERAEMRADEIAKEADAPLAAGDVAAARAVAARIAAIGLPETDKIAEQVRGKAKAAEDKLRAAQDRQRLQKAQAEAEALIQSLPILFKDEHFEEALRRANAFLENPDYAPARAPVQAELDRLQTLSRIQSAIFAGAWRPGLRLRSQPDAVFSGVRENKIIVTTGGGSKTFSLRALPDEDLLLLAARGSNESQARTELALAALLSVLDRPVDAVEYFAHSERLLRSTETPEWFRAAHRRACMDAARALLDDRRPLKALEPLRALRAQYRTTSFYRENMPSVGALFDRVRKQVFDGMVLVDAGLFRYQSGPLMDLPAFYIDTHEVTNQEYAQFLDYLARTKDQQFDHRDQPPQKTGHTPLDWAQLSRDRSNYPVVGVDWYDAFAYAAWRGKRLPTDAEWEKAARGTEGRKFPWGNVWKNGLCNAPSAMDAASGPKGLTPVGSFPQSNSPYGCVDMAGNAREWTAGSESAARQTAPTRGGSWMDSASHCDTTYRHAMQRTFRDAASGFRCVMDPITDQP